MSKTDPDRRTRAAAKPRPASAASGRSADGTVDLQGRFALAAGPDALPAQSSVQKVSHQTGMTAAGPQYDVTLALNNIGAAAFARTMPPTRIMATAGTLSGKVVLRHAEPPCIAEAAMHETNAAAFVAVFNEQANQDAPAPVRAAVALDSQNLTGRVVTTAFADGTNDLTNRIGTNLAKRIGINVSPASLKPNQQAGNPLAKGVKGLGRGIKKLFGRDKQ